VRARVGRPRPVRRPVPVRLPARPGPPARQRLRQPRAAQVGRQLPARGRSPTTWPTRASRTRAESRAPRPVRSPRSQPPPSPTLRLPARRPGRARRHRRVVPPKRRARPADRPPGWRRCRSSATRRGRVGALLPPPHRRQPPDRCSSHRLGETVAPPTLARPQAPPERARAARRNGRSSPRWQPSAPAVRRRSRHQRGPRQHRGTAPLARPSHRPYGWRHHRPRQCRGQRPHPATRPTPAPWRDQPVPRPAGPAVPAGRRRPRRRQSPSRPVGRRAEE
jgi:hypothetical protein